VPLRRKTFLFIWAGAFVAAALVVAVVKGVLVGGGPWTSSILALVFSVIGVLAALAVALCVAMDLSVFRRVARLDARVGKVAASEEEQECKSHSMVDALAELQARHSDLETAYCQLQQLQEASASLGNSLNLSDSLAQLEEAVLGIFDAEEVWLRCASAPKTSNWWAYVPIPSTPKASRVCRPSSGVGARRQASLYRPRGSSGRPWRNVPPSSSSR
jgi:hypothetical protein